MSLSEEISQRLSILDIVSPHVDLRRAGRYYKGCCPFHSEKTPSFVVYPESNSYHCFGCGAHGDIFTFVMKVRNLEFTEALRELAQRAGVQLKRQEETSAEARRAARLKAVLGMAAHFYHQVLLRARQAAAARELLERRGVNAATIEQFQLGAAPTEWDALKRHLGSRGCGEDEMLAAGLLSERQEKSGTYDRFRGRVLFPIRNMRGEIVGFGARTLSDEVQPKYLNSPQTALFDKGANLYGIDSARDGIRQDDLAVVVEGYMDVLMAHQHGMKNVVGSLGTALTERQISLLKRLTRNVALALDPDQAGDVATLKGVEVARQVFKYRQVPVPTWQGLIRFRQELDANISVLALPRGMDPDEVIRNSPQQWRELVANGLPLIDYFYQVIPAAEDLSTAEGKSRVVQRLARVVREISDHVQREHYIQRLALLVGVDERGVRQAIEEAAPHATPAEADRPAGTERTPAGRADAAPVTAARRERSTEAYLLALLLASPEAWDEVSTLEPACFTTPENRQVFERLRERRAELRAGQMERLLDEGLRAHALALLQDAAGEPQLSGAQARVAAADCALALRRRHLTDLSKQTEVLLKHAQAANDAEAVQQYSRQALEIARDLAALRPRRSVFFRDSRDF